MSELLAAISGLFSISRTHEYAQFVELARSNKLATRSVESTQRQMTNAYIDVINHAKRQ
jgi:hypothetical protein